MRDFLPLMYQDYTDEKYLTLHRYLKGDLTPQELVDFTDFSLYKEELGIYHDYLQFEYLLGNSYQKQTRWTKAADLEGEDAKRTTQMGYLPCGAVFTALIDLEVPFIPTLDADSYSADFSKMSIRKVKKGEKFITTVVEFVFLLAQPYFNGRCKTAYDYGVKLVTRKNKITYNTYLSYMNNSIGSIKDTVKPIGVVNPKDQLVYLKQEFVPQFRSLMWYSPYNQNKIRSNPTLDLTNRVIELPMSLYGVGKSLYPLKTK